MEAFKGLDKAELQLELDNHFEHDFARLSFEEQNDWITRLASDLGLKASDLRKAAAKALFKSDFPGWSLAEVFMVAEMDDVTPEATGKMMFGWFRGNKGVAYKDENDRLLIAWKGKHIVVGRNQAFTDFLYSEGEVTFETPRVKRIVEAFKAESSLNSESAGKVAWVRSSRAAGTLYLHLNNSDGKIFKFDVNGVTTLDNGYNDERVFLKASPKVNQWSFTAVSIKEYREAIKLFDERILQLFACSDEDRLLYACWVLAYPFLEYVESRPHLRCEGPSSKGKSRAMDVVSRLVYGENRLKNPTEASNYNDAAQNPLLLIDNIETAQLTKELAQFILTAVSGVEREKMSADSSTSMVSLRARCIINTSGIDNLNRPELINRTIHIVFDVDKYGKKVWSQTFINLIGRDRDRLLSTHVHIIGNVVRRIANGGLKQWRDALQAKYPRHVLGRSLEYICIMALIADELVPVVMPKAKSDEVVDKWMIGQESYVGNIARESNPIVVAIETIFDDARKWRAIASPPKWPYELLCDGETLVGGSAQLVAMLTAAAKRASIHFPYNMPNLLSRRLKDAQGVLDDAGFVLLVGRDKNRKHDIFTISRKREASTKVTQIPKKKATGQKSKSEKNAN
ncbi:MAG: hypothetical protein IPG71_09320 [bacterium]|nr:hypothetical protein [bacterium]